MKKDKLQNVLRLTSSVFLSLTAITSIGYGIADAYRSQIDTALGTKSFITDSSNVNFKSTYETGEDLMKAAKEVAVREGAEGTVIMKNDNNVLPLSKTAKVALYGGAAYQPYMSAAGNSDQVLLKKALTDAGITLDSTVDTIYENLMEAYTEQPGSWGGTTKVYTWAPNKSTGDFTTFKINEANPNTHYVSEGGAAADWKTKVDADVGIVVFCRPGGEGNTYKPGSALDLDGNPTGKNPLALSTDELAVVKAAKETCGKVVVLLNTSCTIEIDPLVKGEYAVDGIAYIGIPNDYQFTGIVQALTGDVNPSGALADTYAVDSTSSPAMLNFGGGYYSDREAVLDFEDARWPGRTDITNDKTGSFGGTSYNGGHYMVQTEGIYTGYMYYETRYYDSIVNSAYKANSTKGSIDGAAWNYAKEVNYSFGHGLSYLPYTQTLRSVEVEERYNGNITATIDITNNGDKEGLFLGQLYVQSPYTKYDRDNLVEKSAIQFLSSGKVTVGAGETESVEISIPTKYMASYDSNGAKTYILDGGNYYFATGAGAHDALNNILTQQGYNGDKEGNTDCVKVVKVGTEGKTDTTTFAVSSSGTKITNVADNADINYYLAESDKVTYLSRQDWEGTWPIDYTLEENAHSLLSSPKKDEWLKELRNQQYTIKTNGNVENMDGANNGTKFNSDSIGYEQLSNIEDQYWEDLVNNIPAGEAVGAVAHGGSRSDTLTNIENPIVIQNDGPNGFNGKALSTNNGEAETDPYYVDPETEAGKFKACVNSQTLLGSSFNPELARDWGKILGNTGLWIGNYQIWGGGLNYHRTPYNGRNTEYLSEDPMLTNILGRELVLGTNEFGIINGPKHIGNNDQEHNRAGVSAYMTEQKLRETDLRGFQGAVEEGGALGLMVAFNRIGAINASHHVGIFKNMIRGEWGFKGLISTDMMNNRWYFNPESCIMATITQMADFAGNNSNINLGTGGVDATWSYISEDVISKDPELVEAARECMKYQLYAFANSAILNVSTTPVVPSWEAALKGVQIGSTIVGALSVVGLGITLFLTKKESE